MLLIYRAVSARDLIVQNYRHITFAPLRRLLAALIIVVFTPVNIFSKSLANGSASDSAPAAVAQLPDSIPVNGPLPQGSEVVESEVSSVGDSLSIHPMDSVPVFDAPGMVDMTKKTDEVPMKMFNPDPIRAVWLSALFPGLGQLYNRRYWKLPLVVGGFMALGYGTSWNNMMLRDYTRAYNDLLDNDPTTKSYMDFFPPTTQEGSLDKNWLSRTLKSRKDFYRRNRDLCIIAMVGVYVLAMVDAYVDASLAHFDISPDLSLQIHPAIIPDTRHRIPGFGLQWALNF